VKDEYGDVLADCHHILCRWKNDFSQFLSVHEVSYGSQIEVPTAEPLVLIPNLKSLNY
jgi:hypothetical protein